MMWIGILCNNTLGVCTLPISYYLLGVGTHPERTLTCDDVSIIPPKPYSYYGLFFLDDSLDPAR